jgi:hypothetical protein
MLRHNPIGFLLVGLLAAVALWGCWCAFQWYRGTREAQALEFNYQRMNNASVAVNALANEAGEYSKRNPSIDPILTEYNIKPRAGASTPSTQPAPRVAPRP